MLKRYKWVLKHIAILLVVSFMMSIVALDYAVDHNIMGYGQLIQGSMTIFGFYLNKTGWIIFLSFVLSIICSIISSIVVSLLYWIFKLAVKLVKFLWKRVKI